MEVKVVKVKPSASALPPLTVNSDGDSNALPLLLAPSSLVGRPSSSSEASSKCLKTLSLSSTSSSDAAEATSDSNSDIVVAEEVNRSTRESEGESSCWRVVMRDDRSWWVVDTFSSSSSRKESM
ncbi:hypothetical protein CRG98_004107 [Punica granatum]|uniref:Uncharacterized protein n=1 Tax=Punica granatum TaxID=22663 RepID=A0A2I0L418_PUNGR|nr:hypothetical protein CRG98_004107 [Punica granatum]